MNHSKTCYPQVERAGEALVSSSKMSRKGQLESTWNNVSYRSKEEMRVRT